MVIGGLRLAQRMLPAPARRIIVDRVFYSIFQTTRIMNDNYGWRPGNPESHTTTGPTARSKQ